jgi:succinyl-diaminopimelate desuccinylase
MEVLNRAMRKIQEDEAVNFTRSLIAIPSIIGDEQAIADYLSGELAKLGIPVECVEAKRGRPNLISHIKGQSEDIGLILVGHTDTVPVGKGAGEAWEVDPFNGDVRNGFIYGLGASDMKGGIASIFLAVKAIVSSKIKLKKGVTVVFCVDEEGGSIEGMKYIGERKLVKGTLGIEAEPTGMCVQGWFKGRTWYEIEVRGKAAHSSSPTKGINAIHHMVDIIHKIRNDGFTYEKHPLVGDCTISFGTIEGGTSVKSIPDLCKCKLEVRTVPGQTGQEVMGQINTYISDLKKKDPTLDANASIIDGKDPMEILPNDPILDSIQGASKKAIGKELELGRTGSAGGDLYFLWKNMGIPGIYFGPGDLGCAHSPNERVEVRNIVDAARCYAAFILEFCGGPLEEP